MQGVSELPRAASSQGLEPMTGFGAGKVILLGEHGGVYGHPVLAGPLSLGVRARAVPARLCQLVAPRALAPAARQSLVQAFARAAELCGQPRVAVVLEADLPMSMGLGSSAAVSVACARVLLQAAGRPCSPARVLQVALEMERQFHGTPSGVDHTTSVQGRLLLYRKAPGAEQGRHQGVHSPKPLRVVVALAGERGPTQATVAALRARQARWPQRYARLLRELGRLAAEGAQAVEAGDLEALGNAMNINQGLLAALELCSPVLEDMVHRLRSLGALGAKLTGAGGDGGAVIGLFHDTQPVVAELTRLGIRCFDDQLAGPRAL
jgi:mevalonate kinase